MVKYQYQRHSFHVLKHMMLICNTFADTLVFNVNYSFTENCD